MSWEQLIWFAAAATLCWVTGAVLAFRSKQAWPAATASLMGSMIFFAYIVGMWITLERPPMRTMGETRLWYSFFLSIAGAAVFIRWKYKWILSFSIFMYKTHKLLSINSVFFSIAQKNISIKSRSYFSSKLISDKNRVKILF